jgi:hypothetical protein
MPGRRLLAFGSCAVAVVAVSGAALAHVSERGPSPLRGAPLGNNTGLRLVVADNPPFVLDVDSGRETPVAGVPVTHSVLWVAPVGGRAAAIVTGIGTAARVYAVRRRGERALSLGTGSDVTPGVDGRSVWIKSFEIGSSCTLREVRLGGALVRFPQPFPCAWFVGPDTPRGLVVRRTRLVDPDTFRTTRTFRWGVVAAAGAHLLLAGPGTKFTLLDTASAADGNLPWPSILGGRGDAVVDPSGRFIAIEFGDPAWSGGSLQVLDVWVLDTRTGRLTELPGAPVFVLLKFTSMAWTDDGRLVLLGETGTRDFVAVWRPGEERLRVKSVMLPRRTSGSDTFAPLH